MNDLESGGELTGAGPVDVLIGGAGPVGLVLANLLGIRGLRVLAVDRRPRPPLQSMAIGITPPSMAILQRMGLDALFTQRGVPICTARVFENRALLGDVDFSRLRAEHRFILSLPQAMSSRILEKNLERHPSVRLLRGVEVVGLSREPDQVRIALADLDSGRRQEVVASFLAGCDGYRSRIRDLAGFRKKGKTYRARFIMADCNDRTGLGSGAHLYFGKEGSVESFPLPENRRRWIVQDNSRRPDPAAMGDRIRRIVAHRSGFDLSGSTMEFQSVFRPVRLQATQYFRGRVVLCGDAAHTMSPIGGQGMNTGWADAEHLCLALARSITDPGATEKELERYQIARRRAFRVAADRSARGMWLGTRTGPFWSWLRRGLIVGILLRPPVRARLAPYFAMLTIPDPMKGIRDPAHCEGERA